MPHNDALLVVPCEHSTTALPDAHCKKCLGTGRRYVPRGVTAAEFDALYEPLRMFNRDA